MALQPIRFALSNQHTLSIEPERYDTREEAQAALDDRENASDLTIAETRDWEPRPDTNPDNS